MEKSSNPSPEEEEILARLVSNLVSLVHEGEVYIHAGHLTLVLMEAVKSMQDPPLLEPHANAGYVMGMFEVAQALELMLRALRIKHAHDMNIPTDELMSEVTDFIKEQGTE